MLKKTIGLAAVTSLFVVTAGAVSAATVDIDFESGFAGNVTNVGDNYSIGGVTFTRGETQNVVKTGAPQNGFVPDDLIVGGLFGNYFLTDDFKNNTTVSLNMNFDVGPVTGLTFAIGDIDGKGNNGSQRETFTATATLLGGGTSVLSFTSGDAGTGNSIATIFDFGSDVITSVLIEGSTPGQKRNIGWGIDNINAQVVPLPAAGWMLIAGLGGLAAASRRRKS